MLMSVLFLSGCNTVRQSITSNDKLTFKQMQVGLLRIAALRDENLSLEQIKEIYKEDFDDSSRFFNSKTGATEYTVYPYTRKNRPVVLGFDQENRYAYFVDIKPSDPGYRSKIFWVKGVHQNQEAERSGHK